VKYALISDIHGNLPALEVVLADIAAREDVDAVAHLGDPGGYVPWPDQVMVTLLDRGISCIAGNYDSTVATDHEHCGCKAETPRQEELSHLSYRWTREHGTPETKQGRRSMHRAT
jgi:predicted phosphodiesterase